MGLRIGVLGKPVIEVDGRREELTNRTAAVLTRLIIAGDQPVTADDIVRDIWPEKYLATKAQLTFAERVPVQQRISELRRLIDPSLPGEESVILRTVRGPQTRYQLVLSNVEVDLITVQYLITEARRTDPATTIRLLENALKLWHEEPLSCVAGYAFGQHTIAELAGLYEEAQRELQHSYEWMGMLDHALAVAESRKTKMLKSDPLKTTDTAGEAELIGSEIDHLRQRLKRMRHARGIIWRSFERPPTSISIVVGDLFEQEDANLVVGFSDTFDTVSDRDLVISQHSVQGQLLKRLYDGDRRRLDRDLSAALRGERRTRVETRSAKRFGKLIRYVMGTVAVLHNGDRRIFGVAYSRMDNTLITRSSIADLSVSLESLWAAIAHHGMRRPIAMPLIGSGLARIDNIGAVDLLALLLQSYRAAVLKDPFSSELRIVVPERHIADGRFDLDGAYALVHSL